MKNIWTWVETMEDEEKERKREWEKIQNVSYHVVMGEGLRWGLKGQVTTDCGNHIKESGLYLLGIGDPRSGWYYLHFRSTTLNW